VENEAFTKAYAAVPQAHPTRITLVMQNGETRVAESGADEDDVASPKTDAQVEAKFYALTRDALGRERAERILERLWNLERASNVAELTALFAIG
jgi:hypothetical protein